jgi:hypothetical protein
MNESLEAKMLELPYPFDLLYASSDAKNTGECAEAS